MGRMVTIEKNAKEVVIVTEDRGGFKAGYCFACGASGWIAGFGYPHHAKDAPGNHLRHKMTCPMNQVLDERGELKKQ